MAPGAELDDGAFDVVTLRRLPRGRLLKLFPTIYKGTHGAEPEVTVTRGREIELLQPEGMPLAPDGELYGHTPARIHCLPGSLEVYVQGLA